MTRIRSIALSLVLALGLPACASGPQPGEVEIRSGTIEQIRAHQIPEWLAGCRLRPCWFEPTFHKHAGTLCQRLQIHVEHAAHYDHAAFRPWRLMALAFKALRRLRPDYPLWRDFPYEYERERLAIDLINGSELLRQWVDVAAATPADLEAATRPDEESWRAESAPFRLYG